MSLPEPIIQTQTPIIQTQDWYEQLISELKEILTEMSFSLRWGLIETYHAIGRRILQEQENFERSQIYGMQRVEMIAEALGKKPRTIYYAIEFAKKYPELSMLKEGKNISWHSIVHNHLRNQEIEKCDHEFEEIFIPMLKCAKCGKKTKQPDK